MTREDETAAKAVRIATLKSLKEKKNTRIRQIKDEANEKIREINIRYADDPERLRAKYAADDYARTERAKRRAAKAIEREKRHLAMEHRLRPFTLGEEIFSSVVQGIGVCLSVAATVLLDVLALEKVPADRRNVYLLLYTGFGTTMALMYVMSILYHALTPAGGKEVFKRLDHIFIFTAIGFTHTAYAFTVMNGAPFWIVSGILWAVCLTGILLYAIAGSRLELVNIILYAALGAAGLVICRQLHEALASRSFAMLITASVCYAAAIAFYSLRKIRYAHAVSNLVALVAGIYLFFSMFFIYS